MAHLFSTPARVNNPAPPDASLRIQSSVNGMPRQIGWGQTRSAGNLIYYGNFVAAAASTQQSSGGKGGVLGGGSGKGTSGGSGYNYSANVIFGIGEGPILAILNLWNGSTEVTQTASGAGVSLGSYEQNAIAALATADAAHALPYRGLALASWFPLQMGNSASLPNLNYEVQWEICGAFTGIPDANPADIVLDYLTNPRYGCGLPAAFVAGGAFSTYRTYCQAAGLFGSDVLVSQRAANDYLKDLLTATNAEFVWSSGLLSIVPYGDTAVTANGATYSPPSTPLFSLGDDDVMANAGTSSVGMSSYESGDPVISVRTPQASSYNDIKVEYLDRTNNYNPAVVEAMDDSAVNVFGLRPSDTKSWHFFTLQSAALMSAQLQLGRQNVRNQYSFTLDQRYIVLDPMDIVAISDGALGLAEQWVRIKEITENRDASLTVVAEEYLQGTGAAPAYQAQGSSGYVPNYNTAPSDTGNVTFYEPPYELAQQGYQVWITAAPVGAQNASWAGAQVWISLDGVTYAHIGDMNGPGTAGTTVTDLVGDPNVSPFGVPDYQPSQSITITVQDSTFYNALAGTSGAAAAVGATLAVVGSEVISYTSATLIGTDGNDVATYVLSGLYRNWHGTGGADIPPGSRFMRLGNPPLIYAYDPRLIGTTVHVKMPSYNLLGGGIQDIATVSPLLYTLQGPPEPMPPTDASLVGTPSGIKISWTASVAANVHHYQIQEAVSPGSDVIGTTTGAQFLWQQFVARPYIVYLFAVDDAGHFSVPPLQVGGALFAPDQPAPTASFSGANLVLAWAANVLGSLPVATYEIRQGTSWAGGVKIGSVNALQFSTPANWLGSQTFWVTGIDTGGNYSQPGAVVATITNPSPPAVQPSIFQTFVSFQITGNPGSLPIAYYSLYRGAPFASAVLLHPKITGSFDQYQELTAGTYTYWMTATDTAGNVSTPVQIQASVTSAPNYVLRQVWVSTFSGTIVNGEVFEGALTLPIDTSTSYQAHFTGPGWSSPSAQVAAGYPLFIEPTLSTASYTEIFDYGASIGATLITASVNQVQVSGAAITLTPDIKVSSDNITYTDLGNFWQAFSGSSFRYVKLAVSAASSDPTAAMQLSNLTVTLSLTQKVDAGQITLDANPSGTPFSFNVPFETVTSIIAGIPSGSSVAFVDFANVIGVANPTGGNVFAYNNSGTRITSGTINWTAVGN